MSSPGYFYTPEDQQAQDALQRKQAIAQALLKQGSGDPGNAAFGGLRNAGQSIIGAFLANKFGDQEQSLATSAQDRRAKALASVLNPKTEFQDVASTPAITGPGQLAERQAAGVYNTPSERKQSVAEALAQSGDPGLMQQFAPAILQNQMAQDNFTREHAIQRQDQAQDYQRDRADKLMRPATAQEKQMAGIDPRTPAMVDAFNNIKPITDPNQITAYQKAELGQQNAQLGLSRAQFGETVRHNKADEEAKLHPFGIGGSEGTGDTFLAALPPGIAAQVKAIASYRQPAPASRSAQSMAIMSAVNQYKPDYDASKYAAKNKARLDFTTGKNGNTVRSLNVAVQHLDQLGQLSDAMGNGNLQLVNKIGNMYASQTGSSAPTNFNAAKQLVGDEIVKAIVGSGGGVSDREEAAHNISAASSPQQLAGVIKTYQGLLSGQLVGLRQQYQTSTGLNDFEDYLAPETRAKLEAHGMASGAAQSGAQRKMVKFGDLP